MELLKCAQRMRTDRLRLWKMTLVLSWVVELLRLRLKTLRQWKLDQSLWKMIAK